MPNPPVQNLSIVATEAHTELSKDQKIFNKRIADIAELRTLLADWEQMREQMRSRYAGEYLPLLDAVTGLQIEMVQRLDSMWGHKKLTGRERDLISDFICAVAEAVLEQREEAHMLALYNKHCPEDDDVDDEDAQFAEFCAKSDAEIEAHMEAMLDEIFGPDAGADHVTDDDSHQAHAHHRSGHGHAKGARKKTAKQLASEAKKKAEEKQVSLSIREVYRKLVSALHPDRETDPQERARKTELMQRVNLAYGKNNLLQLLELQLELEHIEPAALNQLSADRLKHYNQLLCEQKVRLERECWHTELELKEPLGLQFTQKMSPKTLERKFTGEIRKLEQGIREMKRDISLMDDIKALKIWLKTLR